MDCRSKLQRQRSCACLPLDVGNRCSSRRGTARFTRFLADDELDSWEGRSSSPSTVTGLRGLWRRMMAERSKASGSTAAARTRVPYDSHTYAQNFDEGSTWAEPESSSRSFSARFAVPSTILQGPS
ncbi:unnamed protein product [Musa acuminata subsp. burmannicoides]